MGVIPPSENSRRKVIFPVARTVGANASNSSFAR